MSSDIEPVYIPAPDLPPGPRSALVIATSRYEDSGFAQLRSPVRDAEDFADVLADSAIGGFTVTQLVNEDESRIRREIAAFLHGRSTDETLLVYLSCHGILDPRGRLYFAATDTIKQRPQASAVKSADVIDQMDECRAQRQILILDCCFSGSFGDKAGGSQDGPNLEGQLLRASRGRQVLTASRANEYSFEGEPLDGVISGSVFTTGLVAGLRTGEADIDRDGYITVDEAYDHAFQHVKRAGSPQTPQRTLVSGEGDAIILARSAAGRAIWAARLPEKWALALEDGSPELRKGAVNAIADWLSDPDPARVIAAKRRLRQIASDDIPRVADVAREHLDRVRAAEEAAPAPPYTRPAPAARAEQWSSGPAVVLRHDRDEANCAAFSPDGRLLASGGWGRKIRLWDVSTGNEVRTLESPGTAVLDVAFSVDGTRLASAGKDAVVRLWNAGSGRPLAKRQNKALVRHLEFSRNGERLAMGDMSGRVVVLEASALKRSSELVVNSASVFDVAFSPNGSLLALAGGDGWVRMYASTATIFAQRVHSGWATGVAFSPDGMLLASCGADGMVRLHESATGREVHAFGAGNHLNGIAFSRDGEQIAVACQNGTVEVWEIGTGKQQVLAGHDGPVNSVAFSPAERLIASAGEDGTIRLWR